MLLLALPSCVVDGVAVNASVLAPSVARSPVNVRAGLQCISVCLFACLVGGVFATEHNQV